MRADRWLFGFCFVALVVLLNSNLVEASGAVTTTPESVAHDSHGHMERYATTFLFIVGMLLVGRVGAIVERVRFPSVLGELVAGIIFYNVGKLFGCDVIALLRDDPLVEFVAFCGVVLLLFQTGLEEEVGKILRAGPRSTAVAIIGVVLPMAGGISLSYVFFSDSLLITHIFMGAVLVATSVGITSRMFKDLSYDTHTKTLVVGAAVIDDVLGLIVLAVVSVMAAGGTVTTWMIAETAGGAILFLVGAIIIGLLVAPIIGKILSAIHTGVGMKAALALAFCAIFSWAAHATVGLEPIIGAFAAGLVLMPVHFVSFDNSHQVDRLSRWMDRLPDNQVSLHDEMHRQRRHKEESHVETLVEGVARFFVPIFFVHVGMKVDMSVFQDVVVVGYAVAIAAVAVVGKLACGFLAGSTNNKWVTGWAMVARGEVGLVFAQAGQSKNVFTDEQFAVAIGVVVITTFIPPLLLPGLIQKELKG